MTSPAAVAAVVAAQLLFTYAPLMNTLFDSRALALRDWVVLVGVGMATFLLMECEKLITRRLALNFDQLANFRRL